MTSKQESWEQYRDRTGHIPPAMPQDDATAYMPRIEPPIWKPSIAPGAHYGEPEPETERRPDLTVQVLSGFGPAKGGLKVFLDAVGALLGVTVFGAAVIISIKALVLLWEVL